MYRRRFWRRRFWRPVPFFLPYRPFRRFGWGFGLGGLTLLIGLCLIATLVFTILLRRF